MGSLIQSALDDVLTDKYADITNQIYILSKQLLELQEKAEELVAKEQELIGLDAEADTVDLIFTDSENDLMFDAQTFVEAYDNLYDNIDEIPSVFTKEDEEKIASLLDEVRQGTSLVRSVIRDYLDAQGYEYDKSILDALVEEYEDMQDWNEDIMTTGNSYDEISDYIKHKDIDSVIEEKKNSLEVIDIPKNNKDKVQEKGCINKD